MSVLPDLTRYTPVPPLRRQDEKSLWLKYQLVGSIVVDPEGAMLRARDRIADLRTTRQDDPWLDLWETILDAGIDEVLATLVARTEQADDLRSRSPFVGLIRDDDRLAVLAAFNATHPR